jgi:pimeloyl-ACP methyl ester carboxylesterase
MAPELPRQPGVRASSPESQRRASWLTWRTVQVDGHPVEYGEAGVGPVVIFLHGWGLSHRAYKRALSRLVRQGMRVIAPAFPGFGGSAPMPEARDIAAFGRWVARFLDAVDVSIPVLVMGHSFGGGVAISFAHTYPRRVRGLVLLNSIGASVWSHEGSTVSKLAERPLWDWGIHYPSDLWPLRQARRVVPVLVSEALPYLALHPMAFWRTAEIARKADLVSELDDLRRRRLPVVVLWGDHDEMITKTSFDEMCALLGDPHTVTVEGTHSWMIADPDAFGEVMTNVLAVAMRTGGRKATA